jgi:predicted porin
MLSSYYHYCERLEMKKICSIVFGVLGSNAFADVTLYGRIAAAMENDAFPNANQVKPGTTSVQDYGSYFGIRGTDSVYGQTAAVWQLEQFLNITGGEAYQSTTGAGWVPNHPGTIGSGQVNLAYNVLASSDTYIGLQGAWGRIRLGNISNTFRTNSGAVDIYNGANANVFGVYDRILNVLSSNIRYDSPSWSNLSFSAFYSFNSDGNFNTGGPSGNGISGKDMNGYNNAGVYGFGIFYQPGYLQLSWNNQIWQNSGVYQTMGGSYPVGINGVVNAPGAQGINAYASRIEAQFNNPDSWFFGGGAQITQGLAWFGVPGNGNLNNFWIQNPAPNGVNTQYVGNCQANGYCALNQAVLSTAEIGLSFGWHLGNFTPKIGYVYGANLMAGGSVWDIIGGNNQLGATGYQQTIAELDSNVTPRTIAFVNYGQLWYGSAAQNTIMSSSGNPPGGSGQPTITQAGSAWSNNGTAAVGFSHTF